MKKYTKSNSKVFARLFQKAAVSKGGALVALLRVRNFLSF